MTDSGEGLVDAQARIQERIEEREQERRRRAAAAVRDPERLRELQSLRLARAELERQSALTQHALRREQISLAIAELDRRLNQF